MFDCGGAAIRGIRYALMRCVAAVPTHYFFLRCAVSPQTDESLPDIRDHGAAAPASAASDSADAGASTSAGAGAAAEPGAQKSRRSSQQGLQQQQQQSTAEQARGSVIMQPGTNR